MLRTGLAISAMLLSAAASADVIDPFTADHGPIELGPGEEPTEDEAILETSTVLGGFRILTPAVDDDAPSGAFGRATVSGGELTCELNALGGCVSGYDRSANAFFDLSDAGFIEVDVVEFDPSYRLAVSITDGNEAIGFYLFENVAPGINRISVDEIVSSIPGRSVDISLVDNIGLVLGTEDAPSGTATAVISRFGTSGSIDRNDGGDTPPGDDSDADLRERISGTYYDPSRDGEGCQLSLEADGETFILTCYSYLNGQQMWLLGVSELSDGRLNFPQLQITSGGDFGSAFDPDDVVRTPWGSATMDFTDCNNAEIALLPSIDGYEPIVWTHTAIVPGDCAAEAPEPGMSGTYYDPQRSGEGMQLVRQPGTDTYVATIYTYLNGEQVWLLGSAERVGDEIVMDNGLIASGADFGSDFDPEDVERTAWGTIRLGINDCNSIRVDLEPVAAGFEDLSVEMTRLVPRASCP